MALNRRIVLDDADIVSSIPTIEEQARPQEPPVWFETPTILASYPVRSLIVYDGFRIREFETQVAAQADAILVAPDAVHSLTNILIQNVPRSWFYFNELAPAGGMIVNSYNSQFKKLPIYSRQYVPSGTVLLVRHVSPF